MNLTRPLVIFDLETTGTDTRQDRIVQLSMCKITPEGEGWDADERTYLFNPGRPIPEEATAIHGITDAMVAEEPRFAQRAKAMVAWLDGCDFAGYNIRRFDLPLLYEECKRAGVPLDMDGRAVVDLCTLYFMLNPRSLQDCYRQYVGGELQGAHDAQADTRAVLWALPELVSREELPQDVGELSQLCDEEWGELRLKEVDRWFEWTDDGDPVFRQGKHAGKLVRDVNDGYIDWMRREIKDDDVLQVLNLVLTAAVSDIRKKVLDPPQASLDI